MGGGVKVGDKVVLGGPGDRCGRIGLYKNFADDFASEAEDGTLAITDIDEDGDLWFRHIVAHPSWVKPHRETIVIEPPKVSVLEEASNVVNGPRRETYGHPRDNHSRTAAMWSAYLGIPISMRQVCMLNALQKISRDVNKAHRDNLVDLAGWAANAEMVEEGA